MDEVEPALDDVNLHRFLRLSRGSREESQVLIVTHQKRTMEIAAMMYGISLNKDGTTKVVAQQLEHPHAARERRPARGRAGGRRRGVRAATSADEPVIEVPEGERVG